MGLEYRAKLHHGEKKRTAIDYVGIKENVDC